MRQLHDVTAAIGRDAMLTQAAGGNTSVKSGDEMWVKASGAWMRDADKTNIFVPVSVGRLLAALRSGDEAQVGAVARAHHSPEGLRPSIEAVLHAVMPQRAVVHAHAINSTICSVLADGEARFHAVTDRLGLRGCVVPYLKPGVALASAVWRAREAQGAADVVLMQNHGVVVAAASPVAAYDMLVALEKALALPPRPLEAPGDLGPPPKGFAWDAVHGAIAREARLFEAVTRAPLTPDQVVFLGGAPRAINSIAAVPEAVAAPTSPAETPALLYVAGGGALRRSGLTESQSALCEALAEIARRLPDSVPVSGLTPQQARDLTEWEAERFRRAADAARDRR